MPTTLPTPQGSEAGLYLFRCPTPVRHVLGDQPIRHRETPNAADEFVSESTTRQVGTHATRVENRHDRFGDQARCPGPCR